MRSLARRTNSVSVYAEQLVLTCMRDIMELMVLVADSNAATHEHERPSLGCILLPSCTALPGSVMTSQCSARNGLFMQVRVAVHSHVSMSEFGWPWLMLSAARYKVTDASHSMEGCCSTTIILETVEECRVHEPQAQGRP